MNMESILKDLEVDFEEVLMRFGNNQKMLFMYLKKFQNDSTFGKLQKAMEQEDFSLIKREVHTLKGMAANFGFTQLYNRCVNMHEKLKREENETAIEEFPMIEEAYENIIASIKNIKE